MPSLAGPDLLEAVEYATALSAKSAAELGEPSRPLLRAPADPTALF